MKTKRGTGFSLQQMIRGSVFIEPEMTRLKNPKGKHFKDYEILTVPVKNKSTGGTVLRSRPLIKDWSLDYTIKWNPMLYRLESKTVREVLNMAGNVGLCDWRPDYGLFEVTRYEAREE